MVEESTVNEPTVDEPTRPPDRTNRALVVVLAVIAAIVLVALAVIMFRGGPTELDPASPEGVVQQYSEAVIDGDEPAGMEMLSKRLVTNCAKMGIWTGNGIRVTLLSSAQRETSATVSVLIRISYGGDPFGPSESESRQSFELVKEQGEWKIDKAPFELALCEGLYS